MAMSTNVSNFTELMSRGGYIMWPLLGLSVISLTLSLERCWFWLRTNWPGRVTWAASVVRAIRMGDVDHARKMAKQDGTLYGRVVLQLLDEPYSDALAVDAVQSQRGGIDRFMPTLSTIITAAPMLGILGTVIGIISSFQVLGVQSTGTDPAAVSTGIAEALLTTVAGLVVALFTLFFYSAFNAQVDRTLGRLETLIAAASHPLRVKAQASSAASEPASSSPSSSSASSSAGKGTT